MERVKKRMRLIRRQQLEDVPELKRRRLICRKQLEDVPELIQQIQSLLPADQAARTCVVSKSWLHALSTTPALRFQPVKSLNKQQERNYMRLINRTLRRYQRENIPIVTCDLHFGIRKQKSAARAEKWIKHVTSKTCLRELCLAIVLDIASFTLPDEIFSSENLNTLSIKLDESQDDSLLTMSCRKLEHDLHMKNELFRKKNELFRKKNFYVSSNPVIACVNLRVLELFDVHISDEVLHNLLSTSKLLEKINLKFLKGLEKIKVNNLPYLQELKIAPRRHNDILEIHDVPSLRSFLYEATQMIWTPVSVLSSKCSIGNLRELNLDRVRMDDAFLNVINSNFPLLESLTLDIIRCLLDFMDIRCVTLRRLKIRLLMNNQRQVQVNGPKLLVFRYECFTLPTFLFPTIAPEKIELSLKLIRPIDHMLILKMRETLDLSSKFSIEMEINLSTFIVPFDIDDVRTRIPFPATNVEKLLFVSYSPENFRDKSLLIDVLFSICRPNQVEMERVKKRRLIRRQQLEDVPELKRRRLISRKQLEDVPELIQQIQSLLPADQAARTCVVSKSWLHALSTTPILRLQPVKSLNKQQERQYMRFINRTLRRYHRDNLPIVSCDLHFRIHKQKSASRAEKWIKHVTSKTCLKELCLTIWLAIASYTLPDELFSSEKLDKLSLKLDESKTYSLHISSNPVFNCVNLRVLELLDVHISEDVLHNLLSTCKLLEKINLKCRPEGLENIQVNNLHYLHELKIATCDYIKYLEISNVPCLCSFSYDSKMIIWRPVSSNTDSIGSLRELFLDYVSMDDALSDMINSKFPFLESLTLKLIGSFMETLDIRCVSLRRLTIHLMREEQIKVQVYSPKLLFFSYECTTLPDFLFPSIAPEQFELHMMLFNGVDHMFFLKLRDVLNLSSKFKIELECYGFMVPFDIDDVRRRITSPATNVEYLLFETYDKVLWEKSLIIDVLFSICHPDCIEVNRPLTRIVANYFLNPNINERMETKTGNVYRSQLKDGEIRKSVDGKWEALTSSSTSLLKKRCEFKLNWCSQ